MGFSQENNRIEQLAKTLGKPDDNMCKQASIAGQNTFIKSKLFLYFF